jgi:hypothetical protein
LSVGGSGRCGSGRRARPPAWSGHQNSLLWLDRVFWRRRGTPVRWIRRQDAVTLPFALWRRSLSAQTATRSSSSACICTFPHRNCVSGDRTAVPSSSRTCSSTFEHGWCTILAQTAARSSSLGCSSTFPHRNCVSVARTAVPSSSWAMLRGVWGWDRTLGGLCDGICPCVNSNSGHRPWTSTGCLVQGCICRGESQKCFSRRRCTWCTRSGRWVRWNFSKNRLNRGS